MKDVSSFIQSLPNYLKDIKKARVFFITYNSVHDYDGEVKDIPKGLKINVYSGGHRPDSSLLGQALFVNALGRPDLMTEPLDEISSHAKTAQAVMQMEATTAISQPVGEKLIIFNYAGLTAYQESMEYAREIRKNAPSALIFTLTCDCDISNKSRVMERAKEKGEINEYIVTPHCGGRAQMKQLLEAVVSSFKK